MVKNRSFLIGTPYNFLCGNAKLLIFEHLSHLGTLLTGPFSIPLKGPLYRNVSLVYQISQITSTRIENASSAGLLYAH